VSAFVPLSGVPPRLIAIGDVHGDLDSSGLHAVFRGDSPFARWIRERPLILRYGEVLLVHAGLDAWAFDVDFDAIERDLQAWTAHFQGVGPEPEESTFWITSQPSGGPIWSRRFRANTREPDEAFCRLFESIRAHLGFRLMVCGHNPTAGLEFRAAYPHPVFGDSVALIDTGISKAIGGRLCALEFDAGVPRVRYFERGDSLLPETTLCRQRTRGFLEELSRC